MADRDREVAAQFASARYVVVRAAFSGATLEFLQGYAAVLFNCGRFRVKHDANTPLSLSLYGDPGFDTILDGFTPTLEGLLGRRLCPTYSYVRIYGKGDTLRRHTDRNGCEVSVTVAVKLPVAGSPSTLWLRSPAGADVRIDMEAGDACIYAGQELEHWREPLPHGGYVQLFLHYISRDGPYYPKYRFDRRRSLGLPYAGEDEAGHD